MAPKLCRYGCNTMLEGFDEENRKFLEAGTGGLHTKERCQEAKAKLEAKNDHGNESFTSIPVAGEKPTADKFVDHTIAAKGQSKIKIFYGKDPDYLEDEYNAFLSGKIKVQGTQFQMSGEVFAIALYYEEVK